MVQERKMLPGVTNPPGKMKKLDLTGGQISSLPDAFNTLTILEELILDNNRMAALPERIGHPNACQQTKSVS
jgi:Leucine-rich repeat (LRR) protein